MVFANLSQKDKDAFFALLDEYFESRPELLAGLQGASSSTHHQQQTSVASTRSNASGHATNTPPANNNAVNTPPRPPVRNFATNQSSTSGGGHNANGATSPAPSVTSFSKGRPVPPAGGNIGVNPPAIPSRTQTPRVVEPPAEESPEREDIDEAPVSVSSRIAAAQAALGGGMGKPPVPAPRRTSATSYTSQGSAAEKPHQSPPPPTPARNTSVRGTTTSTPANSNTNGLVSSRGIGSIDTSSAGAAASSVFSFKGMGKNEKPAASFAPSQPTFPRAKTRDTFAPPPSRRETQAAPPIVQQQEEEEEEEELQGEWFEALYDYESGEPTDLSFKIGTKIFVTERTSKDWWMANIDGNEGLVPASYIKPL